MIDLVTLATFVFIGSLVWLSARILLRPRPAMPALPSSWTLPTRTVVEGVEPVRAPMIESLAGQFPQAFFAGEELNRDLRRAGYYAPDAKQRFLALRNGLMLLALLAMGITAVAIGPAHRTAVFWTLIVGTVLAIVGWSLPRVIVAVSASRRVHRVSASLPDALDTISMCLQGGVSLQECLAYVGREMAYVHPDLAVELLMVSHQSHINSFDFAFEQFAYRVDAPEVVALAALVSQNQRQGTGVVESIHEFADNLRLKRRQLAEGKARLAELFLLFPVVFCIVPSVLFLLWGPAVLQLIDYFTNLGPITTGL